MSSIPDPDNKSKKTEWIHCNYCSQETKHSVLTQHENIVRGEPIADLYHEYFWWHTTYTLLVCCGCESVTLRRLMRFSEWEDGESEIEFYPPSMSRKMPAWHEKIPYKIHDLLSEVYTALYSNSHRLALMGARTIIDMFILDKIGDIGTFQQKLDALVDRGYLASQQKDILSVALEAGNAAVHRAYKPSSEVLNHVIDVVETLLQSYVLEKASDSVKNEIPHRPRKNSMVGDNGTSTAI